MSSLNIGDLAPDFISINQNGEKVSLTDFLGKKVVLYFYPKANTPGCTAESCNLRDNYNELMNKGFEILGVSADNETKQKNFAEKYELPFSLLADVDKVVIKLYGAWGKKKLYGKEYEGIIRKTFVIGEDGKIEKIIEIVKTKDHTSQIMEAMNQ